jgi:hypothetical protein
MNTNTDDSKTPTGPGADSPNIPATTTQWIIAAHADAAKAIGKVQGNLAYYCSDAGHAEHLRLTLQMQNAYALTLALATLDRVHPDAATELAQHLLMAADFGDSYGEWLWQWGEELRAGQPITLPFDVPEATA